MIVAGLNRYNQLGEESNNKNSYGYSVIIPPLKSKIDTKQLLSYSSFSQHSVWISKYGEAFAIGDNIDARISKTLPKQLIKEPTQVIINDSQGQPFKFVSVVCGLYYTLYQVTSQSYNDRSQLIYCYKNQEPLFLSLNEHSPVSLYGGRETAAVIETNGGIVFITNSIYASPTKELKIINLPNEDKAIKLACCNKFVIALGSSGKAYISTYPKTGISEFREIPELAGNVIQDIAGTYHHCFCVTDTGKVFGYGNNSSCTLGFPKTSKKIEKFNEITKLKKYHIVEVYAGYSHSLFKTDDGKLISCGSNSSGETLHSIKPPRDIVYPPKKLQTKFSNANFCIAGEFTTIFFQGDEFPSNMANRKIQKPLFWVMKENM